jgi:hypothetical protein
VPLAPLQPGVAVRRNYIPGPTLLQGYVWVGRSVNSVSTIPEPSPDDAKVFLVEDEVLLRLLVAGVLREWACARCGMSRNQRSGQVNDAVNDCARIKPRDATSLLATRNTRILCYQISDILTNASPRLCR